MNKYVDMNVEEAPPEGGAPRLRVRTGLGLMEWGDLSGECFDGAAAGAAAAALRAALAALPRAQRSALYDVVPHSAADGDASDALYLRHVRTERSGGDGTNGDSAQADEDCVSAAWALPLPAARFTTNDPDCAACAVLLAHAFMLPSGRELTLTSVRVLTFWNDDNAPPPVPQEVLHAAFGAGGARAALRAAGGTATVVAIDGRVLDAAGAELAGERAAVAAAARAQMLSALLLCIRTRWAGGFLALRRAAGALLGDAAALSLEPLAQALLLARGGPLFRGASSALWQSRKWQAEALEARGDFEQAVALYERNIAEMVDVRALAMWETCHIGAAGRPAPDAALMARLLALAPLHMSFVGVALRRAGRTQEALATYERAQRFAAEYVAAPQVRESLRIMLRRLAMTAHDYDSRDGARHQCAALSQRLVQPQGVPANGTVCVGQVPPFHR
jgi:tetratricopeptide (TPR) repeat protein